MLYLSRILMCLPFGKWKQTAHVAWSFGGWIVNSFSSESLSHDMIIFLFFFFFNYWFIYLFLAVLGLRFCAWAFSSCGKQGPLFIVVRGPLTIVAPLVAEHRLQTRRLSSCGAPAQPLHGMWDPPRPGLEPVFPALAGRLSTTAPPGKPMIIFLNFIF